MDKAVETIIHFWPIKGSIPGCRLTIAFVAYEITNGIDNSKPAHSRDNNYNLAVQSLRKRLVSRLDVTDLNHFDFQSNIFNFSNLQYSVSVCFRIKNINKQKKP